MKQKLGPNYGKLWTASVISNFGDGVGVVAYPWLASAVTRDPLHIALVAVATRIPWLIFSLPAGVITDRVDRRKLVGFMDIIRFMITMGVGFAVLASQSGLGTPDEIASGTAPLPPNDGFLLFVIYAAALLLGIAEVLRDNSAQTLLPSIVSKDNLERANGRMWGAEMVMNSFIGPPIAGFLLAAAFALPFFVDAGTFAVAAALVFTISGQFRPKEEGGSNEKLERSFKRELKEGVHWLWSHPLFKPMAIALGVVNALFQMAFATAVLFAQEILELDATKFGLLLTAGAAGGVLGSLVAARVTAKFGKGASLFSAILVPAVALTVVGLASSAIVVWVMLAIQSIFVVLWNVITVSLRQALIPDNLLGRVNSVYRFIGWGMMPIGSILGGALVLAVEPIAGREWALRVPFLAAAAVSVLLYFYALPRLNSQKIEEASQLSSGSDDSVESVTGDS
jgi:MFS family permease